MRLERQSIASHWLISCLCFCLFLQGSGFAQALPLPPEKAFITRHELETARLHRGAQAADRPAEPGFLQRLAAAAWIEAEAAGHRIDGWLEDARAASWAEADEPPLRVARASGPLPLPARLFPAFLALPPPQSGPPTPPGFASGRVEATPSARAAELIEKAGTGEIPLIAGWNLISLPLDPPDPDPAAVFAPIAGQLARVEAHDVCDVADPWKLYDPADPAASDLTAVTPGMGLWVQVTAATVLPLAGTLPATTDIDLCQGWNHIGFPADQSRAPTAALASIAGKWQRLFGHDAFDAADPFEFFDPAVPAWANDLELMRPGYGYWLLASEATTLTISNQGPPPTAAFTAPLDLDVVTQPTEVVGTVDSDRLESWTLTAQPKGDGPPVTLATGTTPVADAPLGDFDPTLLLNGLYELELTATDFQGQRVSDSIAVTVEGRMKIGHFSLSFVDLAIPVSGLDIEIVRTYQSRDKQPRDFGVGWSLEVRQGSYRNSRMPGDGWQIVASQPPSPFPCAGAVETKSHLTVIRISEREIYRFRPTVIDTIPGIGRCDGRVVFEYVDGPLPGTTLEIIGNDLVYYENAAGNDQLIDFDTLAVFEPEDVRLTTRDGRIFDLDLDFGVNRLEDRNGNELTITSAGISHSTGVTVDFARDSQGRITQIVDPLEKPIDYEYDATGDLVMTTNQLGSETRFIFDGDHRLEDIIDPQGVRALRSEYDDEGRLVKITDALGNPVSLQHDLDGKRDTMTDSEGAESVVEYDARGNVILEIDEEGNEVRRTFDSKDRLLTETNPLGYVTEYTYNAAGDLASVKDPLGNITRHTYDNMGNRLTTVNARGKVTTRTYSSAGNLLSTRNPLGFERTFAYDASGNLTQKTDAVGNPTSYAYDSRGNRTSITDALGNETAYTFNAAGRRTSESKTRTLPDGSTETLTTLFAMDDLGRVIATTMPDGSTERSTYDYLGAEIAAEDSLNRITQFSYDSAGRLSTTTYPDGTSETEIRNAGGRPVSTTDRAGRTMSFTYDKAGRVLTTTLPDGSVASVIYDAAGQVASSKDPSGATTSFVYDGAGRVTERIDALGNRTRFTYDAIGNRLSVEDALGHITRFEYDDAGREITTILPDGLETSTEYDAAGRPVAEIDQAGNRTEYRYDAVGRLTRITDALGGITRYSYDEQDDLISHIDANGRETRYEYDRLSRQTARILPDGSRETFEYDAGGRRVRRTDFNGAVTHYTYDVNDRLLQRTYPNGSAVSFTYTPSRRRATMIDHRGTTTYEYDSRDRLIRQTRPEGYELRYTWDAADRKTSMTVELTDGTAFGQTYAYDPLGRMLAVTDSRGGAYTYAYDAVGNRQALSYPNGLSTSYTYDEVHRLVGIRTENAAGDVIQSHAYQLGPTGIQQSVMELDGVLREFSYDSLYRLTRERVTNAGGLLYQNAFQYDPVGNRTSQERTAADGSVETIAYTFDARDRLLTEASAVRNVVYSWDLNGNLLSRAAPDGASATSYTWDVENRLVGLSLADGTNVSHRYDADGAWLGRTVSGGVIPDEEGDRGWIVDNATSMSQVVGQIGPGGDLEVEYARGAPAAGADELLGWLPVGAAAEAYHLDAPGSVRALSDLEGNIRTRHAFSAFGTARGTSLTQPFGFTGEQRSHSADMYYLRARWMDDGLGRFSGPDPFRGLIAEPPTFHQYLYGRSSPTLYVDPSGELPFVPIALTALVLLVGGFVVKTIRDARRPLSGETIEVSFPAIIHNTNWSPADATMALKAARSVINGFGIQIKWNLKNTPTRGSRATYHLTTVQSMAKARRPGPSFFFIGNATFEGRTAYGFGGHNDDVEDGGLLYWGSFSSNMLQFSFPLLRKWAAHEMVHMITDFGDERRDWSSRLYGYGSGIEISDGEIEAMRAHAKHIP